MRPSGSDQLILFTRYPQAGQTKTRLIPALGTRGAADFQRRMTEHIVREVRKFQKLRPVNFEVRFEGGDALLMHQWLGTGIRCTPQRGNSLGSRMRQAFSASFAEGFQKVVIIGADCPALSPCILEEAFCQLAKAGVVIGPARDGGYYLLGLQLFLPELFTGIDWGTADVLSQTLKKAQRLEVTVKLLEPLADVDRPEDLSHFSYNTRS